MGARMMKVAGFVEPGNLVLDEKPLRFVALPYRSCSARASGRFSRAFGLLLTVFTVALFAWVFKAQAAGDLSRQVPLEVRVQGTTEWWLVPIKTGQFGDLKCTEQGHTEAGMVGQIVIK